MKRFSFKMLAVAAAVCAGCWLGCGGDDNNPANNNGNNNNTVGDANHDGKLICGNGEVWMELNEGYNCASPTKGNDGVEFKSNSDVFVLDYEDNGVWERHEKSTWRTDGNTLVFGNGPSEQSVTYEISNDSLTLTINRATFKKCGGVTVKDGYR